MPHKRRRTIVLAGLLGGSVLLLGPGTGGAADVSLELRAIATSVQEVDLAWSPVAPAEGCATTVWRERAPLATLCGATATFADRAVLPGTRYRYQVVTAPAGAGPMLSNEVVLTTPSVPEGVDVTPPSPPTDLQGSAGDAGVLLSWQSATDDTDISSYEVRRDGLLIAVVDAATLEYLDARPASRSAVTYSVTALDVLGQTSRPALVVVEPAGSVPPAGGSAASLSATARQEHQKVAP